MQRTPSSVGAQVEAPCVDFAPCAPVGKMPHCRRVPDDAVLWAWAININPVTIFAEAPSHVWDHFVATRMRAKSADAEEQSLALMTFQQQGGLKDIITKLWLASQTHATKRSRHEPVEGPVHNGVRCKAGRLSTDAIKLKGGVFRVHCGTLRFDAESHPHAWIEADAREVYDMLAAHFDGRLGDTESEDSE
jgi:hypothetical protein